MLSTTLPSSYYHPHFTGDILGEDREAQLVWVSGWTRIWTQVLLPSIERAHGAGSEESSRKWHDWHWPSPPVAQLYRHIPMCRISGNFTGEVESAAHDSSAEFRGGCLMGLLQSVYSYWGLKSEGEGHEESWPAHLGPWRWKIMRMFCQCWPAATFLA